MMKDELIIDKKPILNLSHRHHFLPQVVLVSSDRAIPSSHCLVFANHDILGNFVEQSTETVSLDAKGTGKAAKHNYLKSWETTTTPPEKALIASARESMVGMSRPLVGSSSSNMLGLSMAKRAKTTRDR